MTRRIQLLFWDVDTQYDFMREDGKLYVPEAESIIPNLARLTDVAASLQIPVLASADDHQASDPEISSEPDFSTTYPPHCLRGTEGAERIAETQQHWTLVAGYGTLSSQQLESGLGVDRPLILIRKNTVDVFSNPNTQLVLDLLRPERIAVYGVALDICNRHAIEGLLTRGYNRLVVVSDATKPINRSKAESLLTDWCDRGVEERTTAALLFELRH